MSVNPSERLIFYAEDVKKDNFKRTLALSAVVAVVVCAIAFSLAFGLRNNEESPPMIEETCPFQDEGCCRPQEEWLMPQNVPLLCSCNTTAEVYYNNLTEGEIAVYTLIKGRAVELELLNMTQAMNLPPTSCDPYNQIFLTAARFDEFGLDLEDLLNAPLYELANIATLALIYITMDGINWRSHVEGWYDHALICQWYGVNCVFIDTLNEVLLPGVGLRGTIPSVISMLPSLRTLDLSGNINVTGSIPSEFGDMERLNILELSRMSLTGSIPSSFGGLGRLDRLSLIDNQLSGSITPEVFHMTSLRELALTRNNFQGSLPSSMGQASSITTLRLNQNSLTGALPSEIQNMTHLELLDIAQNNFQGPIPSFLANLPRLELINLYDSGLSGTIPESFCSANVVRKIVVTCAYVDLCSCCGRRGDSKLIQVDCAEDFPDEILNGEL